MFRKLRKNNLFFVNWSREMMKRPATQLTEVVEQIISRLPAQPRPDYLRWIKTQHRDSIRLISVEEIDYFKAE